MSVCMYIITIVLCIVTEYDVFPFTESIVSIIPYSNPLIPDYHYFQISWRQMFHGRPGGLHVNNCILSTDF